MATIKATCPVCGDVDLTPRQVRVRVIEAVVDDLARRTYAFNCPECQLLVEKPADLEVVRLLTSAGVQVSLVPVPAEAREAHAGAALDYDDLLDFALWLDGHDALAALMEPVRGV
ncbi:MAG TPA: hypothetical protein VIC82_08590 [Candidatus Nanopelagicales bacterium]